MWPEEQRLEMECLKMLHCRLGSWRKGPGAREYKLPFEARNGKEIGSPLIGRKQPCCLILALRHWSFTLKKKKFVLMWNVFKVPIESVTILLSYVLYFWLRSRWNLNSLTRDRTHTPMLEGKVLTSRPLGESLTFHFWQMRLSYCKPLDLWAFVTAAAENWYSLIAQFSISY